MKTQSTSKKVTSSRGPLSTRLLRWSRKVHLWTGVALALFVLVIAVTGLFLLHEKEFQWLGAARVPARLLPAHYSAEAIGRAQTELRDLVVSASNDQHWVVLGHETAFVSFDAGETLAPIAPDSALEEPHAAAFGRRALWVGHKAGLAACTPDGARCRAVALPPAAVSDPHVSALAVVALTADQEELVIATHSGLVYASRDDGQTWNEMGLGLAAAGASSGGDLRIHALARQGSTLLAGTKNGLFGRDDGAELWRSRGLRGRHVWDLEVSGTALWASVKQHPERSDDSVLLVTTDSGVDWRPFSAALFAHSWATTEATEKKLELALAPATVGGAAAPPRATLVSAAAIRSFGIDGSLGPAKIVSLPAALATASVPLKKVLDDLHTGKFFNEKLWLVYDIGALSLVLFVITGLYLWAMPILMRREKEARRQKAGPARLAQGVGTQPATLAPKI